MSRPPTGGTGAGGLLAVVVLHTGVAIVHGVSHGLAPVPLPAWLNVAVLLTTFLGPVTGAVLAWRGHPRGPAVATVSLCAALALGVALHFVLDTPDHVGAVAAGPWRGPFVTSAAVLVALQAVGVVVGAREWIR